MSLKQSIVVVNEFTVRKGGGASGGTRGATPGDYVTRYMAREMATEPIAPIKRNDLDSFVTNYMARADAVEAMLDSHREGSTAIAGAATTSGYDAPTLAGRRLQRSARRAMESLRRRTGVREKAGPAELKQDFAEAQGDGGVAFGHSGVSLSHDTLHSDAKQIQELFDAGHTVLKTVISFDHDYLERMGLVPVGMDLDPDTGEVRRGGYRGHLDQLKLRLAVREGIDRLERMGGFDDLRYVAVIQVDTSHVHCHLAMVDAGAGRRRADGQQKGKLTSRDKMLLRSGIDGSLDIHRKVAHLSSAVSYQRASVSAYVRRWAYESLGVSRQAQFVLACLPEDRTLWRASSNRQEMAKPNRLVREMVEEQLAAPGSPLPEAMAQVHEYANERLLRDGLSKAEYDRLVSDGRERIVQQAMNGVYTVLAAVADDELVVSTPMLSSMSEDYGELIEHIAAEHNQARRQSKQVSASAGHFALRLRNYAERLDRHRALREEMLLRAEAWETADRVGRAAPGSEAMHRFYLVEADYHGRLVSKYQHYLDMGGARFSEWSEQWRRVEDYGRKLTGLRALRADKSIPKMKDQAAAEALGRNLYGQHGGGSLTLTGAEGRAARAKMDSRIEEMARIYAERIDELVESWRASGSAVRVRSAEPGVQASDGEMVLSEGDGSGKTLHEPGATVVVSAQPEHEFEEVKGLDLHELGLDWTTDQKVGRRTAARFSDLAETRSQAADAAQAWMVASGQADEVSGEMGAALADIAKMREQAAEVRARRTLRSLLAAAAERARQARERLRAELEAVTRREAAEAIADIDLEQQAERGVLSDLEAEILAQAKGRAPKPRGATTRLDTGLGGAIRASVNEVVRSYKVSSDFDRSL